MTEWTGFTDEDLRKLKGGNSAEHPPRSRENDSNVRGSRSATGRKPAGRGRPPPRTTVRRDEHLASAPASNTISPNQMLSAPKKPTPKPAVPDNRREAQSMADSNNNPGFNTGTGDTSTVASQGNGDREKEEQMGKEETRGSGDKGLSEANLKELDPTEGISRELCHMEHFQQQQKMMEELNKKKRNMLANAIQQRQKAAKAESRKLQHIQQELGRLDQMLNSDVSIVRDKIEEASRDFLEAQKHYNRVEQQFIAAKLDLHAKEELKESLTEHLYTIIHQNELRKAKKLEELMLKLELEAAEENMANMADIGAVTLPPLAVINPIQVAKTLGHPESPVSPQKVLLGSPEGGSENAVSATPPGESVNNHSTASVPPGEGESSESQKSPEAPQGVISESSVAPPGDCLESQGSVSESTADSVQQPMLSTVSETPVSETLVSEGTSAEKNEDVVKSADSAMEGNASNS